MQIKLRKKSANSTPKRNKKIVYILNCQQLFKVFSSYFQPKEEKQKKIVYWGNVPDTADLGFPFAFAQPEHFLRFSENLKFCYFFSLFLK